MDLEEELLKNQNGQSQNEKDPNGRLCIRLGLGWGVSVGGVIGLLISANAEVHVKGEGFYFQIFRQCQRVVDTAF